LARRLDEFCKTLDEREQQMLIQFLVSAMNPLERLRFLNQTPMLTNEEWLALGGPPGGQGMMEAT
jgi:hypothetical protein